MAVTLAGTGGDPVTDQVSTGTGHSFSYTIPSDATAVIVSVHGYNTQNLAAGLIDELNWDNGAAMDFTHIIDVRYDATETGWVVSAYIMTAGSGNWPGTGAKTLYWENSNTTFSEGYTVSAFSVKGVDLTSPVGQTGTDDEPGDDSITLTDNTADTLGVICFYTWSATGVGKLNTNSQTVVNEGAAFNSAGWANAVKANAGTLQNTAGGNDCSVGFTLLPASTVGSIPYFQFLMGGHP